jgi:hypothetical protein
MNESHNRYTQNIDAARSLSRDAINKIVLLSAGTLSFSVTLFSAFTDKIDLDRVRWSWHALLATVIIGYFSLLLHGRLAYAKEWKITNTVWMEGSPKIYPFSYKFIAIPFALFSVLFPANMIFNKIEEKSWFSAIFRERVNHYVVHELAWLEHRIPILENVCMLTFIAGLILLVTSI